MDPLKNDSNSDLRFTLRLAAPTLTPDKIDIDDLIELLRAIYAGMRDTASDACGQDRNSGVARFSLVHLFPSGSTSLAFQAPTADEKDQALVQMRTHIGNVHARRGSARADVDTRRALRRLGTVIQLYPGVDTSVAPIAEAAPDAMECVRVSGQSSVYGVLERVGGVSPAARVKLYDGSYLTVTLKSEESARGLADRLYGEVGFQGIAVWELPDMTIAKFHADEVLPYRPSGAARAFALLADASGSEAWAVDNVSRAVAELRGNEADEW